jgi:hypothetical protein
MERHSRVVRLEVGRNFVLRKEWRDEERHARPLLLDPPTCGSREVRGRALDGQTVPTVA